MNKQFQGSKKKGREKAYAKREMKRADRRLYKFTYDKAMESGNIEDMAKVMGIKLK